MLIQSLISVRSDISHEIVSFQISGENFLLMDINIDSSLKYILPLAQLTANYFISWNYAFSKQLYILL